MKSRIYLFALFALISCSTKTSVFDVFPRSSEEARDNGFSEINMNSSENAPETITAIYKNVIGDTVVMIAFDDTSLKRKAILFPKTRFDTSMLFNDLENVGSLIKMQKNNGSMIGLFKRKGVIYYVFSTDEAIILEHRPGEITATYPTSPVIEPGN
jgi:hypothetical protein